MQERKRVVIRCQFSPCHNWMAFASWYSFRKMIPEAEVCVDAGSSGPIFRWVPVLSSRARGPRAGDFVVGPTVMAVRDFEGDWSVSSSKSDSQTCLVDYSEGCGNFVADKWINSSRQPFHNAMARFGSSAMTVNEVAVLRMWERCESLYRATGV